MLKSHKYLKYYFMTLSKTLSKKIVYKSIKDYTKTGSNKTVQLLKPKSMWNLAFFDISMFQKTSNKIIKF